MRSTLDQLYERLLFTYPRAYRSERGDELVSTAVEVARPGQRLPGLREAFGFFVGGLRTRSRLARLGSSVMTWADGLRLGAATVMSLAFAGQINNLLFTTTLRPHLLPLAMIAVIVALLRWPRRICLLLVGLGFALTWNHIPWGLLTLQSWAASANRLFVLNPVVAVEDILGWIVPFVVAAVAFIWQPRAHRGPTVWPWWFVGLLTFVPSLTILKGLSTVLFSVLPLSIGVSLVQILWPIPLLVFAFVIREARLSVTVVAWACAGLLTNGLWVLASPLGAGLLLGAGPFVVYLIGALGVTTVINRRLATV